MHVSLTYNHALFRYDIFEVDTPQLHYNITVNLLNFDGFVEDPNTKSKYVNWTMVSTFYLNPSRTLARSKDGKVNTDCINMHL